MTSLICVRRHPNPETRAGYIEIIDAQEYKKDHDAMEAAGVFVAPEGSERAQMAQVMAAAPEMLEALCGVVWFAMKFKNADNEAEVNSWLSKAHAAISKAEGRA